MSSMKTFWRRSAWKDLGPQNGATIKHADTETASILTGTGPQITQHPDRPVTLAVVGCGQRGKAYGVYPLASPSQCKVVAIADPRPKTRALYAAQHAVDATLVFDSWDALLAASAETLKTVGTRLADAVVVAVQDRLHAEVVAAFAAQGYHVLAEKPMATSVEECVRMERAVTEAGVIFGMGHVMRYSPYCQAVSEILRSGQLGEIVNIVHVEPVGYYHFAHSYVRGSWAREGESSFSLMTKCCHDIDLLCHWMLPATPVRVSSFGSLRHFRKSQKPAGAGAATRCLDCAVERDCAYSAKKIYLDQVARGSTAWPVDTIVDGVPDIENVTDALKTGPYGKCVYESENDVCDNQVVNMEFSNGATVALTMAAHTSAICMRHTRIHLSAGELLGDNARLHITSFAKNKSTTQVPPSEGGGHGGGDLGLIRAFVEAVRTGRQGVLGTDAAEVLKSHLVVFAAEKSRREGCVVDVEAFEREARASVKDEERDEARAPGVQVNGKGVANGEAGR